MHRALSLKRCLQTSRECVADICVPGVFRADVKTWSARFWEDFGRCVAVKQLPKLLRKADVIVWCVCPEELQPGMQVSIRGWSTLSDVQAAPQRWTGPARGRRVHNHQVSELTLRDIHTLIAMP